jgi:hypothetical protein
MLDTCLGHQDISEGHTFSGRCRGRGAWLHIPGDSLALALCCDLITRRAKTEPDQSY